MLKKQKCLFTGICASKVFRICKLIFFDWQFCGLCRHKTANKKSLAAVKQPGGRNQADWDSLNRFLWVSTTVSMSSMKRQSIMH